MALRLTLGLCAVVIGLFSMSLCQPPTPRIAEGEGLADVAVSFLNATTQDVLMVYDSEE